MDMNEFNVTVKRIETDDEVQFDVRPFGDRQGEAIDSYLHDRLAAVQYNLVSFGTKLLVVLHDSTAVIPKSAYGWLENLKASGVPAEIRKVS